MHNVTGLHMGDHGVMTVGLLSGFSNMQREKPYSSENKTSIYDKFYQLWHACMFFLCNPTLPLVIDNKNNSIKACVNLIYISPKMFARTLHFAFVS